MRKIQIGVIGSSADLKYSKKTIIAAEKIGYYIAKSKQILCFGAEKDYDSLSAAANRGAKKIDGTTVGFTYNKGKRIKEDCDIIVSTGLERGGGRELVFILSCDVIIGISGGSGTMTEYLIAYQANIPIIALKGYGGWTDKIAGTFIDDRKRMKVLTSFTPKQAVQLALRIVKKPVG